MALLKSEDSKKWITSVVAIGAIIVGYLIIQLGFQLGEWFDLEAKVPQYQWVVQGVGVLAGFGGLMFVLNNNRYSSYLSEVYSELVKVIWPDKESVLKMAAGLVFAISLISLIFVGVDLVFKKLLELFY